MQYWALINNVKVGPLPPEQLLALGMGRETLVWREGLPEWTAAWRLPELDLLFMPARPVSAVATQPCPPTYLAWAIVVTLLCCQITGIVAIVYAASVDTNYSRGDFEGARRASRNALTWTLVSVGAGVLGFLGWSVINIISAFL